MNEKNSKKQLGDLLENFGDFLYQNLLLFETEKCYVVDLIEKNSVPLEIAKEVLFKLLQRGYIDSYKKIENANDIEMEDCFCLTSEGKNFIEITKKKKVKETKMNEEKKMIVNSPEEKILIEVGDVSIQIGNVSKKHSDSDDSTSLNNIPSVFGMKIDDVCDYVKKFTNMNDSDKIRLCEFVQDLNYYFKNHFVRSQKLFAYSDLFKKHRDEVFMVMQPFISYFF